MNSNDFARFVRVLESIDGGEPAPRLSGAPGSFLRRYAAQRTLAVELALRESVSIRKDGKLSGAPVGMITITPLNPETSTSIISTQWGDVARYLALCPELLTVVVFRIWLRAQSGGEALRSLLAAEQQHSIRVTGDFLWSPPGTLLAGRADFGVVPASQNAAWQSAALLKATGDDLLSPVHPLDVRDVYLGDKPVLAQFRVIIGWPLNGNRVAVPRMLAPSPLELNLQLSHALPAGQRDLLRTATGPLVMLLYREAWSTEWNVWSVEPTDTIDAFRHLVAWAAFMRALRSDFGGPDFDPVAAGTRAIRHFDGSATAPPSDQVSPVLPAQETPEQRLALALARTIRIGGALDPELRGGPAGHAAAE